MEVEKQTENAPATLDHIDPNLIPEGWLLYENDVPSPGPPPAKNKKLSLSLKKTRAKSASRFVAPVSAEVQFVEAAKGVVPENTKKNNAWAERAFSAWVEERNIAMPSDPVPVDLLCCHDAAVVCKYKEQTFLCTYQWNAPPHPPGAKMGGRLGSGR